MNYKEFKNLSKEEQIKIEKEFTYDLCELNLPSDKILDKYQIPYSTFRLLKKHFNISRTKEQEYELKVNSRKDKQDEITKKIKQTKLERYGNENYRNDEKIKQTNLEKYGVENVYASDYVKEKKKQTYIEHYGTDHPMKNKDYLEQYIQNRKIKYDGKWNNNIRQTLQTKIEKYGNNQYEIIKKIQQTKLERYGDAKYINSEKAKHTWNNKSDEEMKSILEKRKQTCQEKYGINNTWLLSTHSSISKINLLFAELLDKNNINYELEYQIENRRFDFKVENTLLEINPTYTHNSTLPSIFTKSDYNKEPLIKTYHFDKTLLANKYGFRCIHIWDWDDWNKIIYLLLSKQKLYARNLKIKEVSKQECNEFLNIYHLQNSCNGQKIRYGLYYDDKLIQIMTFGKPRYNKNYEWELLRLCTHKDYKIVGGSQKLFKHFLNIYNPQNVISYCDNSKFSGEVYERLGMIKYANGNPTINWSKEQEKVTQNLLNQRGYDQLFKTNYGKGTSNRILMIEHGWREVYDCGQSVWIWNNE